LSNFFHKEAAEMVIRTFAKFSLVVAIAVMATATATADIIGPYTPDADTLHLWHLDDSDANSSVSDSGGSVNLSKQSGATLGNAAFAGFGTAGNTNAANNSIFRSSVNNPGPLPAPVGAGGAFTYEAMINTSGIAASQQIFAMDSNGALTTRPFWFRIQGGDLHFFNLADNDTDNRAEIPTTGDDAFVSDQWFHAAVTYDGNDGVADNLKFYWTRVDASRTQANLIGSAMINDLSTTATAVYGVGNAFRTVGSGVTSNLDGSIDEVRISGIARGAGDFIFTTPVPEPSALALLGLGSIVVLARRRRLRFSA
jgi:hypothetical protein